MKLTTALLVTVTLGACATTIAEMEARNKDVSLQSLLGQPELTPELKIQREANLISNARANLTSGNFAKAARQAKQALKSSPGNIEAQHVLGEAMLGAEKGDLAEIVYARLVDIDNSARSEMGLGLSLLSQNKFSAAKTHLQKADLAGGNDWRIWNGLGMVNANEGNWVASETALTTAISLSNSASEPHENLGIMYMKQGRITEALKAFNMAQSISSNPVYMTLNHRAAHALNNDMETAKSGADDRVLAALFNQLGETAMSSGERAKAIDYFKRALAVSPAYYADAVRNLDLAKTLAP